MSEITQNRIDDIRTQIEDGQGFRPGTMRQVLDALEEANAAKLSAESHAAALLVRLGEAVSERERLRAALGQTDEALTESERLFVEFENDKWIYEKCKDARAKIAAALAPPVAAPAADGGDGRINLTAEQRRGLTANVDSLPTAAAGEARDFEHTREELGLPFENRECENHQPHAKHCIYCFGCDLIEFDGRVWIPQQPSAAAPAAAGGERLYHLMLTEPERDAVQRMPQPPADVRAASDGRQRFEHGSESR